MKPTTRNNLRLADTHLGWKEHEWQALLKIDQDLIDDYGQKSYMQISELQKHFNNIIKIERWSR